MSFPKSLKELCQPAFVYFAISIFAMTLILLQNLGNKHNYNVGAFSCRVPHNAIVFIIKFIYILFWTWILNLICKDGHTNIAWLLVLLPFIFLFVVIGIIMINQ
jgi:hypothetical protein